MTRLTGIVGHNKSSDLIKGAKRVFLIFCFSLVISAESADDIYKWVDDQGKVHFGTEPPQNKASTRLKIKEPNIIPDARKLISLEILNDEENSIIPPQEFKMYHSNGKLKIHYKTAQGLRLNPTLEYYNWGDLKQKVNYPDNLIDESIKIKNVLTINKISIKSEHFDSIIFSVDYEFQLSNNKSWFFIRAGDDAGMKTKSMRLLTGKHTGEITIRLLKNIDKVLESTDLVLWFMDYHKGSWAKIGRTQLLKVWSPNG